MWHNVKASEFRQSDQSATDEELFQKTKKFVVGAIQKITTNEWLPAMFGSRLSDTVPLNGLGQNSLVNKEFVTSMMKIISATGNRVFDGQNTACDTDASRKGSKK